MSRSGVSGAVLGATAPLRGLGVLLAAPALWPLAVVPVLCAAVLVVALGAAGWYGHAPLADWLAAPPAAGASAGVWRWTVEILLWPALALAVLVLAALLAPAVAEPFLGALTRKVRARAGHPAPEQPGGLVRSLVVPLVNQGKKLGFLVGVHVALLPLLLVPVAGAVAYAAIGVALAWFLLGLTYLEYPLETGPRALAPRERRAWFWRHAPAGLALGAVTSLTALVPCLTFLMLPVAVVGATLLYLDLGGDETTRAP